MNTTPFPALTWNQNETCSTTHTGKTGTVTHFLIERSISRTADLAPYVLRCFLNGYGGATRHFRTVEQAKDYAAQLWQHWLFRAGLQPIPALSLMEPKQRQLAAHNLSRPHQLDLMTAAGWLPCPKASHWHPPGMTDGPHKEDKAVLLWIESLNPKPQLP